MQSPQESRGTTAPGRPGAKAYAFEDMPIAGRWRAGRAGERKTDHDPFTGEVVAELPLVDVRDVDDAARRSWAG